MKERSGRTDHGRGKSRDSSQPGGHYLKGSPGGLERCGGFHPKARENDYVRGGVNESAYASGHAVRHVRGHAHDHGCVHARRDYEDARVREHARDDEP